MRMAECHPERKHHSHGLCGACSIGKWSRENLGRRSAWARREHKSVKEEVFNKYGMSCACCGESNIGFLTIDHINGGGAKQKKSGEIGANGGVLYRWLKRNNFPDGFRTLCWNCNSGRFFNGGICPHESERRASVPELSLVSNG
jgi:hypothetical protein